MADPGITLTRAQLDAWAGFPLTDEEVSLIEEALPHSTLSQVVANIAFAIRPSEAAQHDDTHDAEPRR